MATQHKRGIHSKRLYKSMNSDALNKLLNIIRSNKDYVLLIRDNYFNVYYRGGNVAKVTSAKSVEFDKQYFRQHKNRSDENYTFIQEQYDKAIGLFKAEKYQEYLDVVIPAMDNYYGLGLKSDEERESQHQLCINNSFESDSDYTILDLEYEVSNRSKFAYDGPRRCGKNNKSIPKPRFDIVTVRKSDGKICIMELKKGTRALENKSGLGEHAESYENTVGKSKGREKLFVEEMKDVLKQMKELQLISNQVEILNEEVQYMFVFQKNDKETRTDDQVQVFHDKMKKEFSKYRINKHYPVIELNDGDYCLRDNRL